MLNKKGFTLVELLAVIVILAIIAVIAVPGVLKIISGAREDAVRANVRSAVKAAELAVAKGKTSGELTALDIDNNPFKGGTWNYDNVSRKIILNAARDNINISESNYVVSGDKEEILSNKAVVFKPIGEKLLSREINDALPSCITVSQHPIYNNVACIFKEDVAQKGYIRGPETVNGVKNHVQFANKIWRIVKVNDDESILLITEDFVTEEQNYYYRDGVCDGLQDIECKNNFAESDINKYLNNEFYNTITNKNLIKYNTWDTMCSKFEYGEVLDQPCVSGNTSIFSKVGLLTLKDYVTVAGSAGFMGDTETSNYLISSTIGIWLLGTGHIREDRPLTHNYNWIARETGYLCGGPVNYLFGVKASIVLNPGVSIKNTNMTNIGTLSNPYIIE